MENATDALIMAASVLLLLVALSVSISSFTTLRMEVDGIVSERDKVDMAVDDGGHYINYFKASDYTATRTVNADTVMSSLLRIERESYNVYIYLNGGIPGALDDFRDKINDGYMKFSIEGSEYQNINENNFKELYNEIKGKKFNEFLGIYKDGGTETPTVDKITHRVYTFIET